MQTNERTAEFLEDVQKLKTRADNAIEHTGFSGGGVRINGFASLSGREFVRVLHKHGKRAVLGPSSDKQVLYADCYDNIDPNPMTAARPMALVPQPKRLMEDYTRGAVVYSKYTTQNLSSENINRMLLLSGTVDVLVTPDGFTLMTVCDDSTRIVGGLNSQMLINQHMRTRTLRGKLYFKTGAGKLKRNRKKRSFVLWA